MTKVILNSGGMDSFLMAQLPEWREAEHVFVDIGQRYLAKELHSASKIAVAADKSIRVITGARIAQFEHTTSGIIPYRNAEMILCAAQFGNEIALGVIADEVNSDKSPEFFDAMQLVLDISHRPQYWTGGKTHTLHTPLRGKTKAEHIRDFIERGEGDMATLLETVSCYSEGDDHCGTCSSCHKRWIALTVATGDPDVQYYTVKPWLHFNMDYLRKRFDTYSVKRQKETEKAYATVGITL